MCETFQFQIYWQKTWRNLEILFYIVRHSYWKVSNVTPECKVKNVYAHNKNGLGLMIMQLCK